MQITIKRPVVTNAATTISKLYINDVYFCDCLEDTDRNLKQSDTLAYIAGIKIKHKTAIPYGTYQVVLSFSERFQKYLPELLHVPGFSGIRIHPGNTAADSSGCILPGVREFDRVVNSRVTMTKLMKAIESVIKKEKVWISIIPTTLDNHTL